MPRGPSQQLPRTAAFIGPVGLPAPPPSRLLQPVRGLPLLVPAGSAPRLVGRWGVKSSEHTPPVAGDLRDRCDFAKGGRFYFVRVQIDEKKG